MLETVSATALAPRMAGLPHMSVGWGSSRKADGRTSYTCEKPDRPDGVTSVAVYPEPGTPGEWRIRFEGNLTSALYGEAAKAGSLTREELAPARDALLGAVIEWAGLPRYFSEEGPDIWGVTRLDVSTTWALSESPEPLIRSAGPLLASLCSTQRAVFSQYTRAGGTTAKAQLSKGRVHRLYNKGVEAGFTGRHAMRLETQIRCKQLAGWKRLGLSLALEREGLDMASEEQSQVERLIWGATAVAGEGMVELLMRGGASPNEAIRLWGAMAIAEERGWDALPVPARTAQDWRLRVGRYLKAAGGPEAAHGAVERAATRAGVPLLARDLVAEFEAAEAREGE